MVPPAVPAVPVTFKTYRVGRLVSPGAACILRLYVKVSVPSTVMRSLTSTSCQVIRFGCPVMETLMSFGAFIPL